MPNDSHTKHRGQHVAAVSANTGTYKVAPAKVRARRQYLRLPVVRNARQPVIGIWSGQEAVSLWLLAPTEMDPTFGEVRAASVA